MITTENAIHIYYDLREKHRRPRPLKTSQQRAEMDERDMGRFLAWCVELGIDEPVAYMTERFREMSLASRRRAVPRISQLKSDALAKRWTGWLEGERVADAGYAKRMAHEDHDALVIRALAAAPHVTKEAFKRRFALEGAHEVCEAQIQHSGGYHPGSPWCTACPSARGCTAALEQIHGFDVVALRCGKFADLPASVVSALVR